MERTFTVKIQDQVLKKNPNFFNNIQAHIDHSLIIANAGGVKPDSKRLTAAVDRICAKLQKMYPSETGI